MQDNENVASEDNPVEELDYFLPEGYEEGDEEGADETESKDPESTDNEDKEEPDKPVEEESEEEGSEESEEKQEELPPLEEVEIKVLGEVKKLSDIPREELQSVVRKGEDYDRVREKLDVAQSEVSDWHEVATMFDMKPSEVMEALKDQHFKQIAESEGRNVEDVKKLYESNRKSESDKQYESFVTKYPDVKVDELPKEVKDKISMGVDVTKAYENYLSELKNNDMKSEIEELKAEIAEFKKAENVKKQNSKSKKKSVVKKTSGSDNPETDEFLQGFLD